MTDVCTNCGGTGALPIFKCGDCGGTGKLEDQLRKKIHRAIFGVPSDFRSISKEQIAKWMAQYMDEVTMQVLTGKKP